MSWRTSQVNELLREELSELLLREVKDPRVDHGLVSITEVRTSPDMRHATVFVSHLGDRATVRTS
jgi:ribosome-binding factor A